MKSSIQEAKEKGTTNGLNQSIDSPQTTWKPDLSGNTKFKVYKAKDTTSGFMDQTKAGFRMYDNVEHWLTPAKNMRHSIDTNLTSDERDWLEMELSLPKGTLSPYNLNFWGRHFIKISKSGVPLDISMAADYLDYKLLQGMKEVAFSKAELTSDPFKMYLVESEELEALSVNDASKVKQKAFAQLAKMSIKDKQDFLKVYQNGKFKVTHKHTAEFIDAKIFEVVDQEPQAFLSTLDNRTFKTQIFIQDCIDKKLLVRHPDGKHFINGEMDPFAQSALSAIEYFEDDHNSAIVVDLKKRLSV